MLRELPAKLPIGRKRPAPHRPRLLVEGPIPARGAKKSAPSCATAGRTPTTAVHRLLARHRARRCPRPLGEAARPHQSYVVVYRDTLLTDVPELVDLLRRLLGPPA